MQSLMHYEEQALMEVGEVYNEQEALSGGSSKSAHPQTAHRPHEPAVPFQQIDKRRADDLFSALPKEAKWGEVTGALLNGNAVFVPMMTRNQLESVRTIINRRAYGRLRSRTTEVDGVPGRVLRVMKRTGNN